jgi:hypothetical protein
MTERELIHSQTGKYGKVIEVAKSQRLESLFRSKIPGDRYYMYRIHTQFIKFFTDSKLYVSAPNIEEAERYIYELLKTRKLV